jgi:hypothetical protein
MDSDINAHSSYFCKYCLTSFIPELKGTLLLEDIVNDQLDDMEITVTWSKTRPSNELFSKLKKILAGGILKTEVISKMMIFENAFNQLK